MKARDGDCRALEQWLHLFNYDLYGKLYVLCVLSNRFFCEELIKAGILNVNYFSSPSSLSLYSIFFVLIWFDFL
ncbi:hypothetical protein L6452_35699 [Arctium lappa]|uniref:Uncharacterized protein n=1 Tax=Arctium lappa TaxID=4217 RepID=A0ACB8Y7V8_ARCLA|nr:hypothetical protein L6452_35699 [Arctium lappa]